MITEPIKVDSMEVLIKIFGACDENIKVICDTFDVHIINKDGSVFLSGQPADVEYAQAVIDKLSQLIYNGDSIDIGRVNYLCICAKEDKLEEIDQLMTSVVAITHRGKPIKGKTLGQKRYVDAIKHNTITFGIGPAGTGKTYLAVALAVAEYKAKKVDKILLTRPAVEAGEKLGFLPGDLQEKVNPYLRPLYDALQEMLGMDTYTKMMEKGTIEIAPLAYMRGRTLNNSFIILDEAQNTTKEQIKMFLTRLGENSKMIITGDLTQIDLPKGVASGLKHASRVLANVDDIGVMKFSERDVVRHPLVQAIVKAYEQEENYGKKKN